MSKLPQTSSWNEIQNVFALTDHSKDDAGEINEIDGGGDGGSWAGGCMWLVAVWSLLSLTCVIFFIVVGFVVLVHIFGDRNVILAVVVVVVLMAFLPLSLWGGGGFGGSGGIRW